MKPETVQLNNMDINSFLYSDLVVEDEEDGDGVLREDGEDGGEEPGQEKVGYFLEKKKMRIIHPLS